MTGPNSFNQAAKLRKIESGGDTSVFTATYAITPPGGTWGITNDGTYTIVLNGNQVLDVAGNAAVAGNLNTFDVRFSKVWVPMIVRPQ